jgi:rhodanese-related sulfurtransferase
MGFFKRFRKKETNGADTPTAESAAAVGARAEAVKADAARAYDAPAQKPRDVTAVPAVREVSAEEVKARIDAGTAPVLIDVRELWEHQIANIAQATLIPMNSIPARMDELDRSAEIVVFCHHGTRSLNVATYLAQHGFTNVKNLTGGIDSWARRVDRNIRTY